MLLVLLAKQKNEEDSLFWQCLAGKAVVPAEVVLPTSPPPEAGAGLPPLPAQERGEDESISGRVFPERPLSRGNLCSF